MPRPIRPKKPNARKRAADEKAAKKARTSGGLRAWFERWRASTRRAQARSETSAKKAVVVGRSTGALVIDVKPLSVLKGKDGPFRGAPDPTLIIAAYAVRPSVTKTVLRAALRFRVTGKIPVLALPDVEQLTSSQLKNASAVVIVVAVFEENSGHDVRALTSALEDADGLHIVDIATGAQASPQVMTVRECVDDSALRELSPRGIVVGHGDASKTRSDTWVGAGALVVKRGSRHRHRLNVQSADGHQDWTVEFETFWR